MERTLKFVLAIYLVLSTAIAAGQGPAPKGSKPSPGPRTWTDSTGKHKVVSRYASYHGSTAGSIAGLKARTTPEVPHHTASRQSGCFTFSVAARLVAAPESLVALTV